MIGKSGSWATKLKCFVDMAAPVSSGDTAGRREAGGKGAKPVCKPGSVRRSPSATVIPLGPRLPAASSNLPGSGAGHAIAPLFGLAPDGVYRPRTLPPGECALTDDAPRRVARRSRDPRHCFTLTIRNPKHYPSRGDPRGVRSWMAVYFLLHFPSPCDARPLAGILPCGARTFLCADEARSDCPTDFAPRLSYRRATKTSATTRGGAGGGPDILPAVRLPVRPDSSVMRRTAPENTPAGTGRSAKARQRAPAETVDARWRRLQYPPHSS